MPSGTAEEAAGKVFLNAANGNRG